MNTKPGNEKTNDIFSIDVVLSQIAERNDCAFSSIASEGEHTAYHARLAYKGKTLGSVSVRDDKVYVTDHPKLMLGVGLNALGTEYVLTRPAILVSPGTNSGC